LRIKKLKKLSSGKIAKLLADEGVLGKSGKPIGKKQVQRILSSL
jgi:hypothetical protein